MKFAFLIMGKFNSETDKATIHNGVSRNLYENGIDCIELCGAFGAEGARKIIEATENKIPVGYVTHLPEQEEVYQAAFPQK